MDVARTLRAARRRADLSQAELASRTGTSQAAVSAYESSAKQPTVATLDRLLAATGARLTVEPSATRVLRPSEEDHARASRRLADVLTLAEALPTRHAQELRFPRLSPRAPVPR